MKTFKTKTVTYIPFEEVCPESIRNPFFVFLKETDAWLRPDDEILNLVGAYEILSEMDEDKFWDWVVSYGLANEEIRKDYDTFLDNLNDILCNHESLSIELA